MTLERSANSLFCFLATLFIQNAFFSLFFPRSWPTRIVLPLNDEHRQNEKSSLAPRFHDIRPSLLLFLHRLRGIFIHDKVGLTLCQQIKMLILLLAGFYTNIGS